MKPIWDYFKKLYFETKFKGVKPSKEEAYKKAIKIQLAIDSLRNNEAFKTFFEEIIQEQYLNSLYLQRTEPNPELKKEYSGWCSCWEFIISVILTTKIPQKKEK